jgi:transcription-repair coupling factor (superfamily II helicase)
VNKDFATLDRPGRWTLTGVPEGYDALVLTELARQARGRPVLHICRDDARLSKLDDLIPFFDRQVEVLQVPAWDCLPYDRVPPHRDIVAARIDALADLATGEAGAAPGRIVLTTVAAMLQRVPHPEFLTEVALTIKAGDRLKPETLFAYLGRNGYVRTGAVSEAGEYAMRGGIVDLFPPGQAQPLRIDFFGDDVESLRSFDPLSQRSTEKLDFIRLRPVKEFRLDEQSIERFRTRYRERFGAGSADDPLYESVTSGRYYAGMEHWLPLFHERLVTLFDYLPGALVSLDPQADEARDARLELIADLHEARVAHQKIEEPGGTPYRPLPAEMLYLNKGDWEEALAGRAVALLSPFSLPEGHQHVIAVPARKGHDFAEARAQPNVNLYDAVRAHVRELQAAGKRVIVSGYTAGSLDRLSHVFRDHGLDRQQAIQSWADASKLEPDELGLVALPLDSGFETADAAIIAEPEILGDRLSRPARKRKRPEQFLAELATFAEGDYVVHVDHGIGRYDGLETLDVGGAPHDCLRLIYDGGDKLYIPVENIDVISRYSSEDAFVQLDKLGGLAWQSRKSRVKQRIREIAQQLIKTAAERQVRSGQTMQPPEGLYEEFCARFPYMETEDQARAIEDVIEDLGSGKPMDRLICGDVGFGKTEVALRAAFIAVMAGFQVAIVAPTTLLCRQHLKTFSERFSGLPVRVAQLSRLVASKTATAVKADLADGKVDIIVGTHALLGKSVAFKSLGLMIVDEEQHFGVSQKERLKELRADVHVLTLTATPIPRTLQMALSGVREMSLIATPPVDRLAVRTFVLPYDPVILREAILREHYRGGQLFYICPRIEDLDRVSERLRELVPEIKFVVAHGQMAPTQLEAAMTAFYDRQYDMLLSTSIVESGLDIPTANTIVIHRAEMFGLSQLYQLRGRVGRAKQRGYAYLTLPPGKVLMGTAEKRLEVMQTLDQLGAGFTLASHDLDIRGAGNLLGEEQSGHIREVGVELYQHMLEEAVSEARGAVRTETAEAWAPQINLGMPVLIPESYVADLGVRLSLYRRLGGLVDAAEIEAFAAELVDRFGPLPAEVDNLLEVIAIKRLCRAAGIDKVEAGPKGCLLSFRQNRFARPDKLVAYIGQRAANINLRPDHKLVVRQNWESAKSRVAGIRSLMKEIATLAA